MLFVVVRSSFMMTADIVAGVMLLHGGVHVAMTDAYRASKKEGREDHTD